MNTAHTLAGCVCREGERAMISSGESERGGRFFCTDIVVFLAGEVEFWHGQWHSKNTEEEKKHWSGKIAGRVLGGDQPFQTPCQRSTYGDVDDILVVHHDALPVLERIDKLTKLKPDCVGDPDIYLWAKCKCVQLDNGVWTWTLSPSKYAHEAVSNCDAHLKEEYDVSFTQKQCN